MLSQDGFVCPFPQHNCCVAWVSSQLSALNCSKVPDGSFAQRWNCASVFVMLRSPLMTAVKMRMMMVEAIRGGNIVFAAIVGQESGAQTPSLLNVLI